MSVEFRINNKDAMKIREIDIKLIHKGYKNSLFTLENTLSQALERFKNDRNNLKTDYTHVINDFSFSSKIKELFFAVFNEYAKDNETEGTDVDWLRFKLMEDYDLSWKINGFLEDITEIIMDDKSKGIETIHLEFENSNPLFNLLLLIKNWTEKLAKSIFKLIVPMDGDQKIRRLWLDIASYGNRNIKDEKILDYWGYHSVVRLELSNFANWFIREQFRRIHNNHEPTVTRLWYVDRNIRYGIIENLGIDEYDIRMYSKEDKEDKHIFDMLDKNRGFETIYLIKLKEPWSSDSIKKLLYNMYSNDINHFSVEPISDVFLGDVNDEKLNSYIGRALIGVKREINRNILTEIQNQINDEGKPVKKTSAKKTKKSSTKKSKKTTKKTSKKTIKKESKEFNFYNIPAEEQIDFLENLLSRVGIKYLISNEEYVLNGETTAIAIDINDGTNYVELVKILDEYASNFTIEIYDDMKSIYLNFFDDLDAYKININNSYYYTLDYSITINPKINDSVLDLESEEKQWNSMLKKFKENIDEYKDENRKVENPIIVFKDINKKEFEIVYSEDSTENMPKDWNNLYLGKMVNKIVIPKEYVEFNPSNNIIPVGLSLRLLSENELDKEIRDLVYQDIHLGDIGRKFMPQEPDDYDFWGNILITKGVNIGSYLISNESIKNLNLNLEYTILEYRFNPESYDSLQFMGIIVGDKLTYHEFIEKYGHQPDYLDDMNESDKIKRFFTELYENLPEHSDYTDSELQLENNKLYINYEPNCVFNIEHDYIEIRILENLMKTEISKGENTIYTTDTFDEKRWNSYIKSLTEENDFIESYLIPLAKKYDLPTKVKIRPMYNNDFFNEYSQSFAYSKEIDIPKDMTKIENNNQNSIHLKLNKIVDELMESLPIKCKELEDAIIQIGINPNAKVEYSKIEQVIQDYKDLIILNSLRLSISKRKSKGLKYELELKTVFEKMYYLIYTMITTKTNDTKLKFLFDEQSYTFQLMVLQPSYELDLCEVLWNRLNTSQKQNWLKIASFNYSYIGEINPDLKWNFLPIKNEKEFLQRTANIFLRSQFALEHGFETKFKQIIYEPRLLENQFQNIPELKLDEFRLIDHRSNEYVELRNYFGAYDDFIVFNPKDEYNVSDIAIYPFIKRILESYYDSNVYDIFVQEFYFIWDDIYEFSLQKLKGFHTIACIQRNTNISYLLEYEKRKGIKTIKSPRKPKKTDEKKIFEIIHKKLEKQSDTYGIGKEPNFTIDLSEFDKKNINNVIKGDSDYSDFSNTETSDFWIELLENNNIIIKFDHNIPKNLKYDLEGDIERKEEELGYWEERTPEMHGGNMNDFLDAFDTDMANLKNNFQNIYERAVSNQQSDIAEESMKHKAEIEDFETKFNSKWRSSNTASQTKSKKTPNTNTPYVKQLLKDANEHYDITFQNPMSEIIDFITKERAIVFIKNAPNDKERIQIFPFEYNEATESFEIGETMIEDDDGQLETPYIYCNIDHGQVNGSIWEHADDHISDRKKNNPIWERAERLGFTTNIGGGELTIYLLMKKIKENPEFVSYPHIQLLLPNGDILEKLLYEGRIGFTLRRNEMELFYFANDQDFEDKYDTILNSKDSENTYKITTKSFLLYEAFDKLDITYRLSNINEKDFPFVLNADDMEEFCVQVKIESKDPSILKEPLYVILSNNLSIYDQSTKESYPNGMIILGMKDLLD